MSLSTFLMQVGQPLVGSVLVFVSLCVFWVGVLILRGNHSEYERNRLRVGKSLRTIIWGTVPTKYDGTRDDKVAAGLALDHKKRQWIEQGRLSDEALEDVLAP